jgi:hypothetical protein
VGNLFVFQPEILGRGGLQKQAGRPHSFVTYRQLYVTGLCGSCC